MRYGDQKFVNEPIGNFMGNLNLNESKADFFDRMFNKAKNQVKEITGLEFSSSSSSNDMRRISAVNSRDIKLNHLYAKVQRKNSHKAQLDLSMELTKRMRSDQVFEKFIELTGIDQEEKILPTDFDCLKTVIEAHDTECGKFDDYSLKFVKHIVQACQSTPYGSEQIVSFMKTSCRV